MVKVRINRKDKWVRTNEYYDGVTKKESKGNWWKSQKNDDDAIIGIDWEGKCMGNS